MKTDTYGASAEPTGLSSQATEPATRLRADALQSLARRCEDAAGPDVNLDRGIAKALNDREPVLPPRYTASLDAAMTLVDADTFFHVSRFSPSEGGAAAHVYPNRCLGDDYEADAATPALALCAAALKARAEAP